MNNTTTKKPFNRLLEEDTVVPTSTDDYIKMAKDAYHNDVLDSKLPHIQFTPEHEKIYVRAFLNGIAKGIDVSGLILDEVKMPANECPTLNRYAGTGIDNKENMEAIN